MALHVQTPTLFGGPTLGDSHTMSVDNTTSSRAPPNSTVHGRLTKHRRRPSNASTNSNSSPAVTQFPAFDAMLEHVATNGADSEPPYRHLRSNSGHYQASVSAFGKKAKPLLTHSSNREKKPLDLNLSKAENELRGALMTDSPSMPADMAVNQQNAYYAARQHSRTLSSASQVSAGSAHSNHRSGTTYIHPARQMPHSPTPPIPSSAFEPPGVIRPASSHSSLANIPSLPPPNHYRAGPWGILRSQTSTPTGSNTPAMLPSAPATARSSFDSAFRDRVSFSAVRRSRRPSRTKEPMEYEEHQARIQQLRQEFAIREDKKNEKYRAQEERANVKQRQQDERRQRQEEKKRRKSEAADSGRARHSRARGGSSATANSARTVDSATSALPVRSSTTTTSYRDAGSANQLSAIGYASTTELGRPKVGQRSTVDDTDCREEHTEKIPKRQKTQGAGSAGKAMQSRWTLFWFKMKTTLLKLFHNRR